MIFCGCSNSRIDAICYLASGWPDHLVEVQFALWEIFEPCQIALGGKQVASSFAVSVYPMKRLALDLTFSI
jgi:hypothetical protein